MSIFEKLKTISDVTDELTKEKPTVTVTGDYGVICESYKSVRLFREDCIVIEFEDYDINISGTGLSIGFFTPAMLSLSGKIKHMEYISSAHGEVDEHNLEE